MTEGSAPVDSAVARSGIELATAAGTRRRALVAFYTALAAALAIWGPILYWMVVNWYEEEDYSHGFLIVPLALYFAWERRKGLHEARIRPSWWGLVPLAASVATLTVGTLGVEYMTTRISFVFALMGLVLLLL